MRRIYFVKVGSKYVIPETAELFFRKKKSSGAIIRNRGYSVMVMMLSVV